MIVSQPFAGPWVVVGFSLRHPTIIGWRALADACAQRVRVVGNQTVELLDWEVGSLPVAVLLFDAPVALGAGDFLEVEAPDGWEPVFLCMREGAEVPLNAVRLGDAGLLVTKIL